MARIPAVLWWISPALVLAADERLGLPVDSYVNGSQTWLTDDGPAGTSLEWRLHPVASFRAPAGVSHYELWDVVSAALAAGADPGAIGIGDERRALASLWDGLECFPVYGADVEPAPLVRAATERLGIAPAVSGLVDHDAVGDEWERSLGGVSIVALLADQLRA